MCCLPLLAVLDAHPRVTGALSSADLDGQTSGIEICKPTESTGVAVLLRIVPAALVDVVADGLDVEWTSGRGRNGGC